MGFWETEFVLHRISLHCFKSRRTDFFFFFLKKKKGPNWISSTLWVTVYCYAQTPPFLVLQKNITRDCQRLYWHHQAIHLQNVTAPLCITIYFCKKRKIKTNKQTNSHAVMVSCEETLTSSWWWHFYKSSQVVDLNS